MRSGYIDIRQDIGVNGNYNPLHGASAYIANWSANGHFVYTTDNTVQPSLNANVRSLGLPLRCLSTVLDI